MSEGSWVGLDVRARSVVAGVIDVGIGEVRSLRLPPGCDQTVAWLQTLPAPVRVVYAVGRGLVGHGGGPEEAGEFAGDGDGGDVAGFAACAQAVVEAVEAVLGAPGDLEHVRGLALLAVARAWRRSRGSRR